MNKNNAYMNKDKDLAVEKYNSFKPSNINSKNNTADKTIISNPFLNSSSIVTDF